MSNRHVEKSIRNGMCRMIMDQALRDGTREAVALAIYELMQEFTLDHRDIRDYVSANARLVATRNLNRRMAFHE